MRDPPAHEAKPTRLKVGVDNDSLEPGLNTLLSALIGQLHSQDEAWPRTQHCSEGFPGWNWSECRLGVGKTWLVVASPLGRRRGFPSCKAVWMPGQGLLLSVRRWQPLGSLLRLPRLLLCRQARAALARAQGLLRARPLPGS